MQLHLIFGGAQPLEDEGEKQGEGLLICTLWTGAFRSSCRLNDLPPSSVERANIRGGIQEFCVSKFPFLPHEGSVRLHKQNQRCCHLTGWFIQLSCRFPTKKLTNKCIKHAEITVFKGHNQSSVSMRFQIKMHHSRRLESPSRRMTQPGVTLTFSLPSPLSVPVSDVRVPSSWAQTEAVQLLILQSNCCAVSYIRVWRWFLLLHPNRDWKHERVYQLWTYRITLAEESFSLRLTFFLSKWSLG